MADKIPKVFCPSCGEMVEPFVMITGGEERIHCSQCGLDLTKKEFKKKIMDRILIADDSAIMRKQVSELVISKGITRDIIESENGRVFLSQFSDLLKANATVDLVILDVNMPVINGIDAARTIRAMEAGLKLTRKVPILFFSIVKCDENFKKMMSLTKPSAYLNKGNSADREEFSRRLLDVIDRIRDIT
jgi:CheY-like chemotaxis protein/ribosomal protein S27AE